MRLLEESFAYTGEIFSAHLGPVSARITNYLTEKAIENLQPLLGVTTTYRHTDKQVPTRANYYVANVVSVLENFLKNPEISALPALPVTTWIQTVIEDVTDKYQEMVAKTLSSAYKNEELLSKMIKKKSQSTTAKGEGTGTTTMSDIDKISLQLYLDVSKYGQLLQEKLHIDPATFPPYKFLLQSVSAGEKFRNMTQESGGV